MPEITLTTDPPELSRDDFEECLATDQLFVDYFNEFLQLPSFPEPLKFNLETGGFEVLSSAKHELADKIKAAARDQTPISAVYKNAIANPPIRLPHYEREKMERESEKEQEDIKTSFNVQCLDKEQGIAWIKEKRLLTFLRSELYMEYRLAKLLSQIETSRGGIKLTIDKHYRPWYKPKKATPPPSDVDPTEAFIQRLNVTMGASTAAQTKQWYTIAKQVEETSTTGSFSPRASVPKTASSFLRRTSSSRPISVQSSRQDIGDDADDFLGKSDAFEDYPVTAPSAVGVGRYRPSAIASGSSVIFSPTLSTAYPIRADEAARIMPSQVREFTGVSRVVTVEPELSEDESDLGMGSESDEINEETSKKEAAPAKTYSFSISGLDSYAAVFVAMVTKEAYESLISDLPSKQLDSDVNLDAILTQSPRGSTLSQLDSTVFSEAVMEHDTKLVEEKAAAIAKVESNTRKTISFRTKADDDADSVFSEESDESEMTLSSRGSNFAEAGLANSSNTSDVKTFNLFKSFLRNTIGESLLSLWLDIDKSKIGLSRKTKHDYLQRMREVYVKVGSAKRLPNEVLEKYGLRHATGWTLEHLREVQREIAEPLLLYWAPRFLVRCSNQWADPAQAAQKVRPATSLELRPISSQSYPSPKTITVVPLRPKSCFPRIKHESKGDRGHVISDYHRYINRDIFMRSLDPAPTLTTPNPMPKYLESKVSQVLADRLLPNRATEQKRAMSAGPLTRQTRARFERRKSAAARSRQCALSTPRPRTARTSPPSSVTSESTIKGSPAMESMLQALYHDTRAGWFFTRFCENSANRLWCNCIHFWFKLQDYRRTFYAEICDHFIIRKKAQSLFATFILGSSPEDMGLDVAVVKRIRSVLEPPFEDLFDEAEEYALKLLIVPWNQMLSLDQASYQKIELVDQERRLNVAAKYMGCLKKNGILKKKVTVPTELQSIAKYEEDLWLKVPEEFRSFTFDELIRNRIELEHFRKFLDERYAKTDLLCWLDIETFKRLPHQAMEKRDDKAKDIKAKYLHKKYFFGPNSPATKDEQNQAVLDGGGWGKTLKERPTTELILEVQKYVKERIDKRWMPLFLATEAFQERQRPKSQMSEVAEDVVLQKKKRRGEPWKLLDNRWQSSSRDLMEFRRALTNTITAHQFRRYVSLKGDFLENDVLFWLEVQKYKDFCHIHNEPSAIESKVLSIINCFINSHIPPSLQLDISNEMAEKLIEKRKELGPYVFREAQLTIFRVLFPHWGDFCNFRKTLSDEKLTTTLERQRKRRQERLRKQMREQEDETLKLEEARAAKEPDDLPDILSGRESELGESVDGRPGNQTSWTYGKYVEGLERQRVLLLMENEVKGRTPPEALPDRDPDVETVSSDAGSDADDKKSSSSDDASLTSQGERKRKKKEKIIISKLDASAAADQVEATAEARGRELSGQPAASRRAPTSNSTRKGNGTTSPGPAVSVD